MSVFFKNEMYLDQIEEIANLDFIPFEKMRDSAIVISGSTGLIGSFLIDVMMFLNKNAALNCKIYALGRNTKKAKTRFDQYLSNSLFEFVCHDVNLPLDLDIEREKSYVLHLASNTHPKAYAVNPITTITTNIFGTKNLLDLSVELKAQRFVFASSCEIYGENRDGVKVFDEKYCGYIDSNTLRAGYPESKRCGESLCQAYATEYDLNVVIPRLSRIYGPTMLMDDSKAMSQFLRNGLNGEDIVLKSSGEQVYSYLYVSDAVSGILKVMLDGVPGEAYNLAYEKSNIKLSELARMIADISGVNVKFGEADEDEKKGFSKASMAILDAQKADMLGWSAKYDIDSGLKSTFAILQNKHKPIDKLNFLC